MYTVPVEKTNEQASMQNTGQWSPFDNSSQKEDFTANVKKFIENLKKERENFDPANCDQEKFLKFFENFYITAASLIKIDVAKCETHNQGRNLYHALHIIYAGYRATDSSKFNGRFKHPADRAELQAIAFKGIKEFSGILTFLEEKFSSKKRVL